MTDVSGISINFKGSNIPVLCGNCHVQVRCRVVTSGEGAQFGCTACGFWCDQDKAIAMLKEYTASEARLHGNRMARKVVGKSNLTSIMGLTAHNKNYRFIVDLGTAARQPNGSKGSRKEHRH
ncbi:hypothetical protein [Parasedimentitalea psychrophila]|uniref:Uncharacterized protein n=1 Tax=Parasedimentitalea psychrophila TaxID=2997337 RepID=A0A9Y2L571_9RHOB|nr:hypothetical protein [Parasedimentitalea psychrophila]WIY27822.1 hypothetical protein QPJ95_24025 [Parasedimentitalea psychrophila]